MAPPLVDSKILFSLIFSLNVHVSIFLLYYHGLYYYCSSKAFMFTLKKSLEMIKGRRISAAKIGRCPNCLSFILIVDLVLKHGYSLKLKKHVLKSIYAVSLHLEHL